MSTAANMPVDNRHENIVDDVMNILRVCGSSAFMRNKYVWSVGAYLFKISL